MLTKTWPVRCKAGPEHGLAEGEVEALVSVFGNVDLQGDRVVPGAFTSWLADLKSRGRRYPVVFSHQHDNLDAYVGEIKDAQEREEGLWVKAQLDLEEPAGRKIFKLLKGDRLSGWSFAYDTLDEAPDEDGTNLLKSLWVHEVGPCLMPANPLAQTLAVKSAIGAQGTATVDSTWDAGTNVRHLKLDQPASYYRRMYAWQDPNGDPTKENTYKFPHHMVSADGTIGAANVHACLNGIEILDGARGGAKIPEADRHGVYNHLAKHLRDADHEVPPLKATRPSQKQDDDDEPEDPWSELLDAVDDIQEAAAKMQQSIMRMRPESAPPAPSPVDRDLMNRIRMAELESR